MNKSLIFAFALGAAVGSVVTWQLIKTKYEQIAQEEIDSVKEVFSRREPVEDPVSDDGEASVTHTAVKPSLAEYAKKLSEEGYTNYSNVPSLVEEAEENTIEPYVISYEEYGELDGYDVKSLNYYSDNVLTDDWDNIITDIEGTVGSDFKSRFGENEQDIVYVRNDECAIDYEIVYSPRAYTDIYTTPPGLADSE